MKHSGFTLSELLIALAILGVIATFTIPKVLQSQQDSKFKAIGKETAASVAAAVDGLRLNGNLKSDTRFSELTPYLNYVQFISTASVTLDHRQEGTTKDCNTGAYRCLLLHNGGLLQYHPNQTFGGSGTTNAMYFYIDPDGKVTDGTTNGPGKSLGVYLYYNGKLRTVGSVDDNTETGWFGSSNTVSPGAWPPYDPPWFSWN